MSSDPYDDDDDDRPRRRRRDEEEDERPRRRRPRYPDQAEDDYADDLRPRRRQGGDGLGVTAMVIGIVSLVIDLLTPLGACICPFIIAGVILGLVGGVMAVIFGFMARNRTGSGMGTAGIITGFIAIAFALVMVILVALGVGFLAMNAPPAGPAGGPGGNPGFNKPKRF
jgi:hypothetical protein